MANQFGKIFQTHGEIDEILLKNTNKISEFEQTIIHMLLVIFFSIEISTFREDASSKIYVSRY